MSDRVDDALTVLRQTLMRSMSVTDPFLYPHDVYDEGMASLDVLAGELERATTDAEHARQLEADFDAAVARADALAVQVEQLREALDDAHAAAMHFEEALGEIAKDDELVEANDGAFSIHAFRRCQTVARAALEAGSTTP